MLGKHVLVGALKRGVGHTALKKIAARFNVALLDGSWDMAPE
jgi:hypothetical protein